MKLYIKKRNRRGYKALGITPVSLCRNSEPCEKRLRLTSCEEDLAHLPDHHGSQPCTSRPLLDESRSLFHCYINEDEQAANRRFSGAIPVHLGGVKGSCGRSAVAESQSAGLVREARAGDLQLPERDTSAAFLSHFNIPNFVNSELSSTLGDDDLLLVDPPLILDSEGRGLNGASCDHVLE